MSVPPVRPRPRGERRTTALGHALNGLTWLGLCVAAAWSLLMVAFLVADAVRRHWINLPYDVMFLLVGMGLFSLFRYRLVARRARANAVR